MSNDPLIGRTVAGRFRVDSLIGEGQMARVYLAEQLSMHRHVALKVLRAELANEPKAAVRFRREVEAVTRLRSPHTIQFFDFGEDEHGLLFIAMELLTGGTLRERLDAIGNLPAIEVVTIIDQVCQSLAEAHAAGVVHRDLKPENIYFSANSAPVQPFVKVLDFGLAKLREPMDGDMSITGQRMTVGTPAYLPPEVAKVDGVADWRSDLYALGVMTYEMLTGTRPFDGNTPMAVMIAHTREPIPSALGRGVVLPDSIDAFFTHALAKEPAERPLGAAAFSSGLARALGE